MKKSLFCFLLFACQVVFGQSKYLKDVLPFPLGAAVNPRLLAAQPTYREIVSSEFTGLTAENHMKMMLVHPDADRFDFSKGDEILQLAQKEHKRMHGHTLVWHNQVPKWMNEYKGDAAAWEHMLKNHIQEVVGHYRGKVTGWDVVNEAFLDDGSLRPSIWAKNIPDYIAKSFQWAHEADPTALLFYNDYGQDGKPKKMAAILQMVKELKARNIPIHGLGLQMHINIHSKKDELETVINQSSATGLAIHFSELDVAVNPKNDSTFVNTTETQHAQLQRFEWVFLAYLKIPKNQQYGITFWNVTDGDSWLRSYFKRPKEFPLLFDETYLRKPMYDQLVKKIADAK